jgi:hypothetical protein
MTPQEFAAKIKAKYPQYASLNDVDLTRRMVEKYPQYKSQISFERTMPGAETLRSAIESIPEAVQSGKDQIMQGYEQQQAATLKNPLPLITGGIKSAAGVATIISSPLAPVFKPVGKAVEKVGDVIGSSEKVQKFAESKAGRVTEQVADVAADTSNIIGTFTGLQSGIAKANARLKAPTKAGPTPFNIQEATNPLSNPFKKNPEKIVTKRVAELKRLEDSYSQIRKVTTKAKSRGVNPLDDLARTDLLRGAVDDTGTIRTQSATQELNDFIKPYEGTVSAALKREGVSVTLKYVADELKDAINKSSLEGEALVRALDKVDAEVKGLALRSDNTGRIILDKIHDAKINKYNTIDYTNGASKIADKAIARAFKTIVEKNTKSADVAKVNAELSRHFAVLDLLEKLDGKKVDGGKLGKYFASTIGSVVGAHFGPLGSIVGAEAGARIKGAMMSSKFSGETGLPLQMSSVVKEANRNASLPPLALPAPKPGAPRTSFPSGPTIPLPSKSQSTVDALESVRQSNRSGSLNQSQAPTIPAVTNPASEIISTTLPQKGAVSSPGTKSSRPSTVTNTSTSKGLTERGDVSALKTDTSGSFDATNAPEGASAYTPSTRGTGDDINNNTVMLPTPKSGQNKIGQTLSQVKLNGQTEYVDSPATPLEALLAKARAEADRTGSGSVGNYDISQFKGDTITVYHGTSPNFASKLQGNAWSNLNNGSYLSLTKGANKEALGVYGAGFYAKQIPNGEVVALKIPTKNLAIDNATGELRFVASLPKDPLTSSISKAKAEGKTFDEWVKGLPKHASKQEFEKFDRTKIGTGEGSSTYGRGLYIAGDEDANLYARVVGGKTLAVEFNLDTRLVKLNELVPSQQKANSLLKELGVSTEDIRKYSQKEVDPVKMFNNVISNLIAKGDDAGDRLAALLQEQGYDGLTYPNFSGDGDFTVLWNTDKATLKTRAQLKAEWDKIK